MPTFAGFWAGISGTIEANETPFQAMRRELDEETNLIENGSVLVEMTGASSNQGGLYVDVKLDSSSSRPPRIIRVYPFVVYLKEPELLDRLELRGTEHDRFDVVSVRQLFDLRDKSVPGLYQAFVHSTYGKYFIQETGDNNDDSIPKSVYEWADDRENGASVMIQNALKLLKDPHLSDRQRQKMAQFMRMARPSMVPIVNVMQQILDQDATLSSIERVETELVDALDNSVTLAQVELRKLMSDKEQSSQDSATFTIATISRSGTLRRVLEPFVNSCTILCSQSTPGDEGRLMATDLGESVICMEDGDLLNEISKSKVDVVLIGADCIFNCKTEGRVIVNKVGTRQLCQISQQEDSNKTSVICCTDRFKIWDDIFPPPLELDLFEEIPEGLVSKILLVAEDT